MINKKGFTLIEILVAVLIIGILAAIAVTQYKKAVIKSRISALMPLVASAARAQEEYYMVNNEYATSQNVLSIDIPDNISNASISLGQEGNYKYVLGSRSDVPNVHYIIYQTYSKNFPNNIHCEAKNNDNLALWLCEKGLEGLPKKGSITDGFKTFILMGKESDGNFLIKYTSSSCVSDKTNTCNTGEFTDSTCYGKQDESCTGGEFTDSTCYGQAKTACINNTFVRSTAEIAGGTWGGFESNYLDHSVCRSSPHGGCGESTFDDNSICYGYSSFACRNSTFTNNSACYSNRERSCDNGTFSNSTCYANSQGSCGNGTFVHSTVEVSEGAWGGASSSYSDHSVCRSSYSNGGCGESTFDGNSSCDGYSSFACRNSTFTNNSVCYANVTGTCNNNKYESGSYCSGSFCPAGSPRQDGTIRQVTGD
ncbi:MAG: prepilin-type N-terminal cleavage/methylation domain-containing protein [Elusimicrobiaceae bacterium]|nr:prepilin-type N-terminal cleavage/methylation domain-containing protein [Elusimicrobiaceae bacterium]